MTKDEAAKALFCTMVCGAYCNRSGKCNADMFAGRSKDGYLISIPSESCRLPPETVERMKLEYGYSPQTKRLTGYKFKATGAKTK